MKWCCLFLFMPCVSWAQQPEVGIDAFRLADELMNTGDADVNYEEMFEQYYLMMKNPMDINQADEAQLESVPYIRPEHVAAILNLRKQTGKLQSLYELQTLDGMTPETFSKIKPFFTVQPLMPSFWKTFSTNENAYVVWRTSRTLQQQKGYTRAIEDGGYQGSQERHYLRFRNSVANRFSIGLTAEKDPGEKMEWSNQTKGFDFLSGHLQVQGKGFFKNILVGDFAAQFGQGLVLGNTFNIGKSAEAVTGIRRATIGFVPFVSAFESGFFRGGASSLRVSSAVTLHSFYSQRQTDGRASDNEEDLFNSINQTGFHRTLSEYATKNTLQEKNYAGVLQIQKQLWDVGLIAHQTQFSGNVQPTQWYDPYAFSGTKNTNLSVYLNKTFSSGTFFSEVAHTMDKGFASIAGLLISATQKLDVSMMIRKLDKNFYNFYSNAVIESTTPRNESGIYWGLKYQVNKKMSWAAYLDVFQFDQMKYRIYSPSTGYEWLARWNYSPTKKTKMYVQLKHESKSRNVSSAENLYTTQPYLKKQYWLQVEHYPLLSLGLRTRMQHVQFLFDNQSSLGWLFFQDVLIKKRKWELTGRLAIFDTDTYDARLYVNEPDVWLAFTFPAYYGRGYRQVLLFEYAVDKKMEIQLRYAQSTYVDREEIGTGNETIAGNQRQDVRVQLVYKLNK